MYHKLIDDICFLKSLFFKNKLTVCYPTRRANSSIPMRIWMGAPAPNVCADNSGKEEERKVTWKERKGEEGRNWGRERKCRERIREKNRAN
jgi:hypothetical protein